MDILITVLLILLTFGAFIFFSIKKRQTYWLRYDIPSVSESIFFFGRSQHVGKYFQSIYMRFRDCGHPFVGCFAVFSPAILLIDLDLLKRIFISDFESFPDRGFYQNIKDDPLSVNLLRLEGESWRRLRSKLTLTFTSAKMKFMFPTMVEIGDRLVTTLNTLIESEKKEVEVRNLCACFTTDVIGSVAFGIECNSLANPETKFRVIGDKAFQCYRFILENVAGVYPKFFQCLHVKAFTDELIQFYSKIVRETLAVRKEQQIRRNDFVDILIELSETQTDNGEPMLTIEEIIGQMFAFFIAGYETSSSTLTYCLYELSQNQEIQEKARSNVMETLQRFNGELSYECVKQMFYLEQVVSETLRKYPVAPMLRRVVRKRYPVPNTSIYLEKGVHALIPVYAIHHDPNYYPEPDKFNPERFSPEEVQKRHPMSYIPFGAGPRVCIAERFGKIEVLIGVALLLKHFRLSPSERTPKQLQFDINEKRILKVKNMYLNVEKL